MSLMNVEVYDALKAAGTPEHEARQAAIELATMGGLLLTLAERVNGVDSKLNLVIGVMLVGFAAIGAALWQIFLRLPR
jgi:hypothetical protein